MPSSSCLSEKTKGTNMKHSALNTELRDYFSRGDIPTQEQFYQLIDAATDNQATFSLIAHLFGMTVDCVVTEQLTTLDGNLYEEPKLKNYNLVTGETVLIYLQDDPAVNGVYTVSIADDVVTLTLQQQSADFTHGLLLKANRSQGSSASFYEYRFNAVDAIDEWVSLKSLDIPEYMTTHLLNARLPAHVDLTQNGANSKVKATLFDGKFDGQFDGDGSAISALNATELTSGKVKPERFNFAMVEDIHKGVDAKVLSSESGRWLNHKLEALACPQLLNIQVRCAETTESIDVLQPPTDIDQIILNHSDYVLLTAQNTPSQNGVWQLDTQMSPAQLIRVNTAELSSLSTGSAIAVKEGSQHQGQVFVVAAQYSYGQAAEYYWQPSSAIAMAGIGLKNQNSQISVDFASVQDVQSATAEKVVDASVLAAQLATTSMELTDDYTERVNTQKFRIDSILSASDADKDSFAEIVTLINSVDTESDTAFANYAQTNDARSTSLENNLATESQSRITQNSALETAIQNESQVRQEQNTVLTEALQNEVTTRISQGNERYTKTESDTRYIQKTGDTLSGHFNIETANLVGNLNVEGAIVATHDVTAFSDQRLKSNVMHIENALERIAQLQGVTFTRTDLSEERRFSGLIAQQVANVLPEVVHQEGEYLSVAYGNMVGLLVEGIKALNKKVAHLETQLEKNDC